MELIDLSLTLEPSESEPVPVEIEYIDHATGADILGRPGGIDRAAFPGGMGLSLEHVRLTSHSGTHVDAPAHYGPLSGGAPAQTIEEVPLAWFYGPGVVLDCPGAASDGPVQAEEIEAAIARAGRELRPLTIVLVRTGADARWGTPEYFTDFRGISAQATRWLLERGIKVIGVDSFGFDPPFHRMLEAYRASGDPGVLWPAHLLGREMPYCQIERLAGLDRIPRDREFLVACFPVKIRRAGAGPSRVVAIVP
jgi:kynurenine formamidase